MKAALILSIFLSLLLTSCSEESILSDTDKVDRIIENQKAGDKNFVNDIASQTNNLPAKNNQEKNLDLSKSSIALKNNQIPGESPMPTTTPGATPSTSQFESVTELKSEDSKIGTGTEAVDGKSVTVHYTGMLTNSSVFDTSVKRGQPFTFTLGAGSVIKGWDQGVKGMKVGGIRRLYIPPQLGYGSRGVPGTIPPGATLIFDVQLLDVK